MTDTLRRIADSTTQPDPWTVRENCGPDHDEYIVQDRDGMWVALCGRDPAQAAFIAAASPAVVIGLLDRVEAAERERETYEKDWDALVKLIAESVGTDEDRDAAEQDELDEFDPWRALRDVQGRWNAVVSERNIAEAKCERLEADAAKVLRFNADREREFAARIERQTAERIATYCEPHLRRYMPDADATALLIGIESGAWRGER